MIRGFVLICFCCFVTACAKHQNNTTTYKVPAQWQPYVDAFIAEAAKRGHTINKTNLVMKSDINTDELFCASCNSLELGDQIQKIVSIYSEDQCWFNDQQLEDLIFHELGHCILGRKHVSDILPNGNMKSIMNPGRIDLYSPCSYSLGTPCDNSFKRAYYVDELFDELTPNLLGHAKY
jgi:hypothetical protein